MRIQPAVAHARRTGKRKLPCRVKVEFEGLEWFLYNRTPSYDIIIDHIVNRPPFDRAQSKTSFRHSRHSSAVPEKKQAKPATGELDAWWMEFLPAEIICNTGSIVLGNRSTPTVLIIGWHRAEGAYSVVKVPLTLLPADSS